MKYSNKVIVWLFIGLVMVLVQVVVGGITRLTESGLSITKWEVVEGTIPPLNDSEWQEAFDLYKSTPQYAEINEGMSLSDFKFIYFWEFIHRFWARIMGFVFLIPFVYFLVKRQLDKEILIRLLFVVLLAGLAATFGWIMVASGLIARPWVNAYKLSIHLLIALSVFTSLLWTFLHATYSTIRLAVPDVQNFRKYVWFVLVVFIFQVFLGGVLAGMKAAVVYPTWPDMQGSYFPSLIFDSSNWNAANFNYYDRHPFMAALIHFLHRNTAYILFVSGIILSFKLLRLGSLLNVRVLSITGYTLATLLTVQMLLGIVTVLKSVGHIPVLWGVLHQAGAVLLLSALVFIIFITTDKK